MRNLKKLIPVCLVAATAGCMETAGTGYPATSYGYGNGYYSQPSYYSQPTYYSQPSYYRSQPTYYSQPQVVTQTRYVPVASPSPRRGPYGDYDRDGIPNRYDRDKNGDGVPDRYQRKRY